MALNVRFLQKCGVEPSAGVAGVGVNALAGAIVHAVLLTGLGISSGAAVSAVLTYRLATYWLPVLPGWYSWRLLQRMDYV
jgi:undecaprenyl-diphosphatase